MKAAERQIEVLREKLKAKATALSSAERELSIAKTTSSTSTEDAIGPAHGASHDDLLDRHWNVPSAGQAAAVSCVPLLLILCDHGQSTRKDKPLHADSL